MIYVRKDLCYVMLCYEDMPVGVGEDGHFESLFFIFVYTLCILPIINEFLVMLLTEKRQYIIHKKC